MTNIVNFPLLVFVLSLVILWLSARIGASVGKRLRPLEETERAESAVVVAATLTLLGLIIGFGFSMVVSRYDQRKNYEEEEANAIGTEYLRAGLLGVDETAKVRGLLKNYLEQRVLYYESHDPNPTRTSLQRHIENAERSLVGCARGGIEAVDTHSRPGGFRYE